MSAVQTEAQQEVAQLIVESLKLEISPGDIAPEALLFGDEGLGLDSIDVLEVAFAISKTYGLNIKSGDSDNIKIFTSLASLSDYIFQHKKA